MKKKERIVELEGHVRYLDMTLAKARGQIAELKRAHAEHEKACAERIAGLTAECKALRREPASYD